MVCGSGLSTAVAEVHYETHFMPRRVRDYNAEENYERANHGAKKLHYRKVAPNEIGLGSPFPVWSAGIKTFSCFGKGIGIYFMQLLILAGVALLTGMVMMIAVDAYRQPDYGIHLQDTSNKFMLMSAACTPAINVSATFGCDANVAECTVRYRENCSVSLVAVLSDLSMSVIFVVAILSSKLLENKLKEDLDEAIQTVQDYSVMVKDPPADADDPDEWYEFFSRFGKVRYVSVIRDNLELIHAAIDVHSVQERMQHLKAVKATDQRRNVERKVDTLERQLRAAREKMNALSTTNFPVAKVFVTFELEEYQRLCMTDLEVPDLNALLDIKDPAQVHKLFRGTYVLDVREPPEPDNILWGNMTSMPVAERIARTILTWSICVGLLIMTWYLIDASTNVSANFLAFVIAALDTWLPMAFQFVTKLNRPASLSRFENIMQQRLFAARLLLSTLLPYVQSVWSSVLDVEFIQKISIIQASACFVGPVLAYLDISGFVMRNLVAPCLSETQQDLNRQWTGRPWSLAERYTSISKVLFVSLFYSLLTPFSIFLSCLAFLLMFFVDRYLLLRKWKPSCMLDEEVANRLQQQALLAVLAHMYVTSRFIYSWPMDNAYLDLNSNAFVKVDKFPSFSPFAWSSDEVWQSPSQRRAMFIYKRVFLLIACIVIILWIIVPVFQLVHKWFFYTLSVTGDSQRIPFSAVHGGLYAYEPTYDVKDHKFLCSFTRDALPEHRPPVITKDNEISVDLSSMIPVKRQQTALTIVKHYGDEPSELEEAFPADSDVPIDTRLSTIRSLSEIKFAKDPYQRGYVIRTTENGSIARVPPKANPEIPSALLAKITPQSVELSEISRSQERSAEETKTVTSQSSPARQTKSSAFSSARRKQRNPNGDAPVASTAVPTRQAVTAKRTYTPKPLYQAMYGLSSSSDEDDPDLYDPKNDRFFDRMTGVSRSGKSPDGPLRRQETLLDQTTVAAGIDVSKSFVKPKRSESPPKSNYRS